MKKILILSAVIPNTKIGKHLVNPTERFINTTESLEKWARSDTNEIQIEFCEIINDKNINTEIYEKLKNYCKQLGVMYGDVEFNFDDQLKAETKGAGYSELLAVDKYFKKNKEVDSILKVSGRYYPDNFNKFKKIFLSHGEGYVGSHYFRKVNSVYLWIDRKKFYENYEFLFKYVDDRHGRYIENAFYKITIGNEFYKNKKITTSGWESYKIRSGSVKRRKNIIQKIMVKLIYKWI